MASSHTAGVPSAIPAAAAPTQHGYSARPCHDERIRASPGRASMVDRAPVTARPSPGKTTLVQLYSAVERAEARAASPEAAHDIARAVPPAPAARSLPRPSFRSATTATTRSELAVVRARHRHHRLLASRREHAAAGEHRLLASRREHAAIASWSWPCPPCVPLRGEDPRRGSCFGVSCAHGVAMWTCACPDCGRTCSTPEDSGQAVMVQDPARCRLADRRGIERRPSNPRATWAQPRVASKRVRDLRNAALPAGPGTRRQDL
jgi:hypothetical protein